MCFPLLNLALLGGIFLPIWMGLFLCLPILGDSSCLFLCIRFICFDPCLHGVNFYCKIPMGFIGAVSLISWTSCSWDPLYAIYVGSLAIIGFCLLLDRPLVGPSHLCLTESHSTHHVLYTLVQVLSEQNQTAQETNPHPTKITPTHNHTINSKWANFHKGVKRLWLLKKGKKNTRWLTDIFPLWLKRVMEGTLIKVGNRSKVKRESKIYIRY